MSPVRLALLVMLFVVVAHAQTGVRWHYPLAGDAFYMYIDTCVRFEYFGPASASTANVQVVDGEGRSFPVASNMALTTGVVYSLDVPGLHGLSPSDSATVQIETDVGDTWCSEQFEIVVDAVGPSVSPTCANIAPSSTVDMGLCVSRAVCADLVTDRDAWGLSARGVDLRAWTASTLHYIGCPSNGCGPADFFCTDTATSLTFGSNGSVLRAAVDVGNVRGDDWPSASDNAGCCTTSLGLCNAPDKALDATALCSALGYSSGTVVSIANNFCPEPNAVDASGLDWTSDFTQGDGYGESYTCTV